MARRLSLSEEMVTELSDFRAGRIASRSGLSKGRAMKIRNTFTAVILGATLSLITVNSAKAIPAFARKYKTSCSTCHYAFPKLNAFGYAFYNNGLRYPGGDANFIKEDPVSLGSEAYKSVFPDAIWPADIPGSSPIAVYFVNQMQMFPHHAPGAPSVNFEFPNTLEFFAAGTVGDNISAWGELEMTNADQPPAYLLWLQYDFKPQVHLRFGKLDPMPITATNHHRLTATDYNYGHVQNGGSGWLYDEEAPGMEVWGAGNGPGGKGGWTYRLGVLNGAEVPGTHFDADNHKDLFYAASYKFGGLGEIGGTEGQASATSEFYKDNYEKLTLFGYTGSDVLAPDSTTSFTSPFTHNFNLLGLNANVGWERFDLNGVYEARTDGQYNTSNLKSAAWMTELNYVAYPWLVGVLRYEWTDLNTSSSTPDPETNLIPGVTVVLRANARLTVEYLKPLDTARKNDDEVVVGMQMAF